MSGIFSSTEDAPEQACHTTHVRIGEIRIASVGFLKATLGSCVAVAMINRTDRLCGLAHCFLPFAPPDSTCATARFADRAVFNLVQRLAPDPTARKQLRAFLGGGGRLLSRSANSALQVGQLNIDSARASLGRFQIRFSEIQVGGSEGCCALLDCNNLTFACEKLGRMPGDDDEKDPSWN